MRRLVVPLLGLLLLAVTACDGGSSGSSGPDLGDDTDLGLPVETVPACPFTAAELSGLVGETLNDEGGCNFRSATNGETVLSIVASTRSAGEATWEYQRNLAQQSHDFFAEIEEGDKGYLAVRINGAEAAVISDAGAFTVSMLGFQQYDSDGYQRIMHQLLGEIMA